MDIQKVYFFDRMVKNGAFLEKNGCFLRDNAEK